MVVSGRPAARSHPRHCVIDSAHVLTVSGIVVRLCLGMTGSEHGTSHLCGLSYETDRCEPITEAVRA